MKKYLLLEEDEKHEHLANFLLAQERDHYLHTINKERYEKMLEHLPQGDFRNRIHKLHSETCSRIEEVTAIIEATMKDVPTEDTLKSALARAQLKQQQLRAR